MNKQFTIFDSMQMNKRQLKAEEFYNAIFDPDEIPLVVTDEASLYDIYLGDELELIEKVKKKYGVTINEKHFNMPFWQLIDILEKNNSD